MKPTKHLAAVARYSFDIKKGDAVHEVGIDAKTGKVLENSIEGGEQDKD